MKTIAELTAEFYNALNSTPITNIVSNRIYWINSVTVKNTFPLITYQYFDTSGEYSFGTQRVADEIIFQTNVYVDPQEQTQMDTLVEELKTALNAIGYRNINSPIEFFEEGIDKIVRPMRWERYNV